MNGQETPKPPHNLLGGYATGNLSPQEQEALLRAALEDQALFDDLMEEQLLKEALEEPGAKAGLLEALRPKLSPWQRFKQWWATPVAWSAAGAAATACLVVGYLATRPPTAADRVAQTAAVREAPQPVREAAPPPAPSASSAPERKAPTAPQPAAERPAPAKSRRADTPAVLRDEPLAAVRAPEPPRAVVDATVPAPVPAPATAPAAVPAQAGAVAAEAREQYRAEKKETAVAELSKAKAQAEAPRPAAVPVGLGGAALSSTGMVMPSYVLLRRTGDGSFAPVSSGQAIGTAESLRFRLTPAQSGMVTISRRDDSGTHVIAANLPVEKGQTTLLPPQGGFVATAGPQTLQISFQAAFDPEKDAAGLARQNFRNSSVKGAPAGRASADSAAKPARPQEPLLYEIRVVGRAAQ